MVHHEVLLVTKTFDWFNTDHYPYYYGSKTSTMLWWFDSYKQKSKPLMALIPMVILLLQQCEFDDKAEFYMYY